jgi:CHAD domain-containing protein
MKPEDLMVRALCDALEPMQKNVTKELRKARGGDPDAVHEARVLLRRLRVGLEVMGSTALEPGCTGRVADELRNVERLLGPVRDDDVLLEHLDGWLAKGDRARKDEAKPLRDLVGERRSKHRRRLAKDLERHGTRAALRGLRLLLAHPGRTALAAPKNPARSMPTRVRHFIHGAVWRAYEEVLAYDDGAVDDVDVIHKFRSSCRRLRYTLELFEGALHDLGAVVDPLHALQSRLGELHDHAVVVGRIDKWLSRSRLPRTPAIEEYVAERGRARDAMIAEFGEKRRAVTDHAFRVTLFRALDEGHAVCVLARHEAARSIGDEVRRPVEPNPDGAVPSLRVPGPLRRYHRRVPRSGSGSRPRARVEGGTADAPRA